MFVYSFEKLDIWKNARELVKNIYETTASFPEYEKFGITNQIRRASTSITANIAEGMSRISTKDQCKFITISFGSAVEVTNFLILSLDLNFISEEKYVELREKIEKITYQLNALHKSLQEK